MIVPSLGELLLGCLAVGMVQLLVTFRFLFRLRGELIGNIYVGGLIRNFYVGGLSKSEAANALPVSIIVPCKGKIRNFERNIQSILSQNYPAELEFIFVVPSRDDPAYAQLKNILKRFGSIKARLLSSGAVPVRCSEKILNVLFACERVSPGTEALLFADPDLMFPPGWVTDMVSPLSDPSVGATTAHGLMYMPVQRSVWGMLKHVWEAVGITYLDITRAVSGNSFAIMKRDFDDFGIAEAWKNSICEDLSLAKTVKRFGRRICFVRRAIPVAAESCDSHQFLTVLNRWIVYLKFYLRPVWVMGAILTAFKIYVFVWASRHLQWSLLGVLIGMDIINIYLVLRVFDFYFFARFREMYPARRKNLFAVAVLAAPLLQIVYAVNFLNSVWTREVVWGGYKYRIRGPDRIEVVD